MPETKRRPGRPAGRKETRTLYLRLGVELHDAFENLRLKTRRSANAEGTLAIERHLEQEGVWTIREPEPAAETPKRPRGRPRKEQ